MSVAAGTMMSSNFMGEDMCGENENCNMSMFLPVTVVAVLLVLIMVSLWCVIRMKKRTLARGILKRVIYKRYLLIGKNFEITCFLGLQELRVVFIWSETGELAVVGAVVVVCLKLVFEAFFGLSELFLVNMVIITLMIVL